MTTPLRKLAKTLARVVRIQEGQTRAQQVQRSIIVSGDTAASVSDLLVGAAETAALTNEQAEDIARLDESDILSVDALADAGDLSDLIEVETALADQVQDASDQFDQSAELDEATHQAHMGSIGATELAIRIDAELSIAKVELEQALSDATAALAAADLARTEASAAVADAAAASSAASQAVADAVAAARLAEGSNTFATVPPVAEDAAGKPIGALWFVRGSGGAVTNIFELTSLGWVPRPRARHMCRPR